MPKISPTRINTFMDMSHHGLSRPFKGPGVAANNLTDTKYELVKCQIMFN
jgi:hypothetical protein